MANNNEQARLSGQDARRDEQTENEKIDYTHDEKLKDEGLFEDGEEAEGGKRKKSPEEIALVRKLDFTMLPMLWVM